MQAAIAKGAAAVMCRNDFDTDSPRLPVVDTLDGLWKLAGAARSRFDGKVVAITGSAGKTTMRRWLEQLLNMFAPEPPGLEKLRKCSDAM